MKCKWIIPFLVILFVQTTLSITPEADKVEIEEDVANKIQRWKRQLELSEDDILLDTADDAEREERRSMSNWEVLNDSPATKEGATRGGKTWWEIQKERNKKLGIVESSVKSSATPTGTPPVKLANGDWCEGGKKCAGDAECLEKKYCICKKPLTYGTSCKRTDGSFFGALILPFGFFVKPKSGLRGSAKEWKIFRQLENKAHKALRAIEDTMTLKSGAKCNKDLEGKVDGVLQYFGNLQKIVEKDFNKYSDQAGKLVGKKKEQICDRRKLLKCVDGNCDLMLQGSIKDAKGKPVFELQTGVKCGNLLKIFNSYYQFKCSGKEKCGCDNKDLKVAVSQWNSESATTPKPKPAPKPKPKPKAAPVTKKPQPKATKKPSGK